MFPICWMGARCTPSRIPQCGSSWKTWRWKMDNATSTVLFVKLEKTTFQSCFLLFFFIGGFKQCFQARNLRLSFVVLHWHHHLHFISFSLICFCCFHQLFQDDQSFWWNLFRRFLVTYQVARKLMIADILLAKLVIG